jgi:hypothetical protein
MRDLRDRLGEALRRHRHGLIRPLWADMNEPDREAYRRAADMFVRTANGVGIVITTSEE